MPPLDQGHDVIERFVAFTKGSWAQAVSQAFGMPQGRIGTVSVIPDEQMPDAAFFSMIAYSPDTTLGSMLRPGSRMTVLNVGLETALLVGVYLEGRTPELPPELRHELLGAVRQALLLLAHETVHSLRVDAVPDLAAEQRAMAKPGVKATFEALTQAATEVRLDDILRAAGAAIDPDIHTADDGADRFYAGVADVGRTLIDAVSRRSGMTREAVAQGVAQRHFGPDAVTFLATAYLGPGQTLPAGAVDDLFRRVAALDAVTTPLVDDRSSPLASRIATARSLGGACAAEILQGWDAIAAGAPSPRPQIYLGL